MKVLNSAILLLAVLCISQCSHLGHLKTDANHQSQRWTEVFGSQQGSEVTTWGMDLVLKMVTVSYTDSSICGLKFQFAHQVGNGIQIGPMIGLYCENVANWTVPNGEKLAKITVSGSLTGVNDYDDNDGFYGGLRNIQFESTKGTKSEVYGDKSAPTKIFKMAATEWVSGVRGYVPAQFSAITGVKFVIASK